MSLYVFVYYSLDQGLADFFCRPGGSILGLVGHLESLLDIPFLFFYSVLKTKQKSLAQGPNWNKPALGRVWPVGLICWLLANNCLDNCPYSIREGPYIICLHRCLVCFVMTVICIFPHVIVKIKICRNNYSCNCYFVAIPLATTQIRS